MLNKNCLKKIIFLLSFFSIQIFSDPWISAKDEFLVKELEYLAIKNGFSIDSSAYPIPLALLRNPNENMFNNISLMADYISVVDEIVDKESKKFINEIGFSSNSEFNPFRFMDSKFKDKNSFFFSNSYLGERFASKLSITILENPYQERKYDFNDSFLAAVSGNFILGIGNYDRWWGPSHNASLILSNYSKPSPGFFIRSLEGFTSPLPLINSFGKLNFSFFANQLDNNRKIKNPYLLGGRLSINPINGLTLGITRSIMFGGKGKDNSFEALWDSVRGDASVNKGKSDINIDNELAGFDVKYSFEINNFVWSIYGQYIGEDGTDYWPWRTFYSTGTEIIFPKNGLYRSISFEYYDTFYYGVDTGDNVIYEHGIYSDGYRYKGSPIGAFIDGDSEFISLSFQGEIDEKNIVTFNFIYGDFSKEKGPKTFASGKKNSWNNNKDHFYGIILNFDFKINSKTEAGLNFTSLSEELIYRGRVIEKNILGLDFKYRF